MAASLRCSRANGFPPVPLRQIVEARRQPGNEQKTFICRWSARRPVQRRTRHGAWKATLSVAEGERY